MFASLWAPLGKPPVTFFIAKIHNASLSHPLVFLTSSIFVFILIQTVSMIFTQNVQLQLILAAFPLIILKRFKLHCVCQVQ